MSAERANSGVVVDAVRMRADALGDFGYLSFAADDQFQIEETPLHQPESRFAIGFYASFNGLSTFQGNFNEVFPGRGNSDENLASFYYYASGLWYLATRWGGAWQKLSDMTCEVGPRGQTVVQGRIANPGFGNDYWTFVINNMAELI